MELKTLCRWFVIIGTLVILSIKFGIRPNYHFEEPARLIFGIAPNLLGAFLFPFAVYWLFSGKYYFVARIFRIQSLMDLRIVCMLGFGILVINEYLQLFPVFGRTFDYFDIASSAIGLSVSYFVFARTMSRYQLQ